MKQDFELAPMHGAIRVMTYGFLLMPIAFLVMGRGAGPGAVVLTWTGIGLIALWLGVWLYSRPTRFEVGPENLTIVWPIRKARYPLARIHRVRSLRVGQVREEFGRAMRIGVGGMWGVFGWLWSRPRGLMEIYASRIDTWVVVEHGDSGVLFISPKRDHEFVAALSAKIGAPGETPIDPGPLGPQRQ